MEIISSKAYIDIDFFTIDITRCTIVFKSEARENIVLPFTQTMQTNYVISISN